ncbi:MAG: SDR family NAD(P)-dependent oxidoreductase [Bernardetiaceae bacterium]
MPERRILVTGGSRGIGRASVVALAEAGYQVGLHFGRNLEAAQSVQAQFPSQIHLFQADLSKPAEVVALWEEAVSKMGGIDTLVNNAGVAVSVPVDAPAEDWLTAWQHILQVNLIAAAQLSRKAVAHFQEHPEGGRLIFVASRAATRGDTPEYLAYAASKAGMVAVSKSLARAYGKAQVKSFVLAPGFTETDMAQDFIDRYGKAFVLDDLALPDLTQPEDIAHWVAFLASGRGDHATGCTIDINAGSYVR